MQAPTTTIDARIVLTVLAIMCALAVAVVTPLTAGAANGPDHDSVCWTGSYIIYLECIEANSDNSGERGTASVVQPAIVPDTVTDYLFMEQNAWGEGFDPTGFNVPSYFPSPDDASLAHNGIPSY